MTLLSEIILLSAFGDDGVGGGGSAADNGIPSKCVMGRLRFPFKGLDMREDRVGRWLAGDEGVVSVHVDFGHSDNRKVTTLIKAGRDVWIVVRI